MTEPDLALACRLVKACHCMYNLDEGFAADPFFPQVGFTAPPAHIEVNDLGVDACLIGAIADGAVLAFRGTLLPLVDQHAAKRALDWVNDFNLALVPVDGLPGKVHAALGRSTQLLWPHILPVIQELTRNGTSLIVSGHSKGAVLACYAALRLAHAGINVAAVYTFGSPRVGNAEFARAYGEAIRVHWRYESYDDIFPHLPPSVGMRGDSCAPRPRVGDACARRIRGRRDAAIYRLGRVDQGRLTGARAKAARAPRANNIHRTVRAVLRQPLDSDRVRARALQGSVSGRSDIDADRFFFQRSGCEP